MGNLGRLDTINSFYREIDGHEIAKEAIKNMHFYYAGFEYGGPTRNSFFHVLSELGTKNRGVFYDLGSGIGDKVLIASYCFSYERVIGIELLPSVHNVSERLLQQISNVITQDNLPSFVLGDFIEYEIKDANVVYISLDPLVLEGLLAGILGNRLDSLKKGSIVITTQVPFTSDMYELLQVKQYQHKLGVGTLFIHEKMI